MIGILNGERGRLGFTCHKRLQKVTVNYRYKLSVRWYLATPVTPKKDHSNEHEERSRGHGSVSFAIHHLGNAPSPET